MNAGANRHLSRTQGITIALAGIFIDAASLAVAAIDDGATPPVPIIADNFDIFTAPQISYDNNIYRLSPDVIDLDTLIGPHAGRSDVIKSVVLGIDGQWGLGRESLDVSLQANRNWYLHNNDLDNTGGTGHAILDWSLGDRFTGQAGEIYTRSLANFANTLVYVKDLIATSESFASIRYELISHWLLIGAVRVGDTQHSASVLQFDDFRDQSGNMGIEYELANNNFVGFEYRYTEGHFPELTVLNGLPFNRDYRQDTERLVLDYDLTSKTTIDVSAGYLERSYPYSTVGAFSGDVWRASVSWQATTKSRLVLAGWRELSAYVDAESNYFVGNGVSVSPKWSPTEKLSLSFIESFESQHFIASDSIVIAGPLRRDNVTSQQAVLTYTPRAAVVISFSYQHLDRTSNYRQFPYGDKICTLDLTVKL